MSGILSCFTSCFRNRYTHETTDRIALPRQKMERRIKDTGHFPNVFVNDTSVVDNNNTFLMTAYSGAPSRQSERYTKQLGCCRERPSSEAEYQAAKRFASFKTVEYDTRGPYRNTIRTIQEHIDIPVRGCCNIFKRIFCCC